jgi:hypothetical protein
VDIELVKPNGNHDCLAQSEPPGVGIVIGIPDVAGADACDPMIPPDGQVMCSIFPTAARTGGSREATTACAEKSNFASRFNLIGSSSPKVKNIPLPVFRKCGWVPPSHLAKGRIAIVTNVGWDAVDASSATDERGLLAYGEAV